MATSIRVGRYIDGLKVKLRRAELGLSQTQLARIVLTTDAYVSKLENSEGGTDCGVAFAFRLADALQAAIEDITSEFSQESDGT